MSRLADIKNQLEKITNSKDLFNADADEGQFNALSFTFSSLNESLREYIQELTRDKIVKIINKLSTNEKIDVDDLHYIQLWIVGDAEHYIQIENNFSDWLQELKRIVGEIENYKGKDLDLDSCNKLGGLAKDAVRVIADIAYFKQFKDRLNKFKESTKELDSEERLTLARMLKAKLTNSKI